MEMTCQMTHHCNFAHKFDSTLFVYIVLWQPQHGKGIEKRTSVWDGGQNLVKTISETPSSCMRCLRAVTQENNREKNPFPRVERERSKRKKKEEGSWTPLARDCSTSLTTRDNPMCSTPMFLIPEFPARNIPLLLFHRIYQCGPQLGPDTLH